MDRVILDTDVSSLSLKHRLPSRVLTRLVGPRWLVIDSVGVGCRSAKIQNASRTNTPVDTDSWASRASASHKNRMALCCGDSGCVYMYR